MRFKVLLIFSVIGLALVLGLSYFSSKGKVYIDLSNVPVNAAIALKIHQEDGAVVSKNVTNKSFVTLNSGTYELSLHSGPNSLITVAAVPSFFGTTTVSGSLENEQKRTFVGTNPSPCMLYVVPTFYSIACGDDTSNLQQQIVPTLSTPGYTVTPEPELVGTVLGTAATNTATYVLLENYTDEGAIQDLVQVGSDLSVQKSVEIPTFTTTDITITASGKRVLVYSATDTIGYVYDESKESLQKITLPKPDEGFELVHASLSDTYVVATYSEQKESDGIEGETITGKSTLVVQDDNAIVATLTVSKPYSKAVYCEQNYICAVAADGLDIYQQTGDTLKKTTTFPSVYDLFTSGDTARFIDTLGIKIFDSKSLKGHYEYTTGKYTVCGVSASVDGYILCVIDTKKQKHALFVSTKEKAGVDEIDKKVLELLKSPVVSGVAAVQNYVYVIPDYGDVDIFTQDADTTARINQNIDSVLSKSTISKQQYFVINAGNPL